MGASQRAEGENPAIIKNDQQLEKEVQVTAGQVLVEMHVTNWAAAQKEDPKLDAVLQWLEFKKKTDLRTCPGECIMSKKGWMVWRNCQNFTTLQCTLYLCSTPKGGEQGSVALCGTQGASNCCREWMPSRCRTPRPQLYLFPATRTFLVARNGQVDETSYQGL